MERETVETIGMQLGLLLAAFAQELERTGGAEATRALLRAVKVWKMDSEGGPLLGSELRDSFDVAARLQLARDG